MNRIMISAKRMDMLITDALNYSKTVRGEFPLSFVNIDRLLREMLETYPEFLAHKGNIRIRGELHPVLGNEAALIQCFSNLVGNALKFAAPERLPEVAVWSELVANPCQTAPAGPSPADPSNANGGSVVAEPWVRVWVEDNGIGIGSRMLPRIFKMFSRGTTRYEGTGIGLALVRKVVQRLGGRVGVESEEGRGSRFWLELPTSESETPSKEQEG